MRAKKYHNSTQKKKPLDIEEVASKKKAIEEPIVKEYQTRIPYSSWLKQRETNDQFRRFLELFKQLHNNLPFVEALEQMP